MSSRKSTDLLRDCSLLFVLPLTCLNYLLKTMSTRAMIKAQNAGWIVILSIIGIRHDGYQRLKHHPLIIMLSGLTIPSFDLSSHIKDPVFANLKSPGLYNSGPDQGVFIQGQVSISAGLIQSLSGNLAKMADMIKQHDKLSAKLSAWELFFSPFRLPALLNNAANK